MKNRFLVSGVIGALLAWLAVPASGQPTQCGANQIDNDAVLSASGDYLNGFREFSTALVCNSAMGYGNAMCGSFPRTMARVSFYIDADEAPFNSGQNCVFMCSNQAGTQSCTFVIDTVDGLPVELLEFAVGEDSAGLE